MGQPLLSPIGGDQTPPWRAEVDWGGGQQAVALARATQCRREGRPVGEGYGPRKQGHSSGGRNTEGVPVELSLPSLDPAMPRRAVGLTRPQMCNRQESRVGGREGLAPETHFRTTPSPDPSPFPRPFTALGPQSPWGNILLVGRVFPTFHPLVSISEIWFQARAL